MKGKKNYIIKAAPGLAEGSVVLDADFLSKFYDEKEHSLIPSC